VALSIVQAVSAGTGESTSGTLSPTIEAAGAGDLVVLVVSSVNTVVHTISVSDSASQEWTLATSAVLYNANDGAISIYYVQNSYAITSVTITPSSPTNMSCGFLEVSGVSASSPLDQTATATSGTGSSTAATASASETTQASEIAIGAIGTYAGNPTISGVTSGWTAGPAKVEEQDAAFFSYYQILSSKTALTLAGTLGSGTYWGDVIATFVAASGGLSVTGSLASASGANGLLGISLAGDA